MNRSYLTILLLCCASPAFSFYCAEPSASFIRTPSKPSVPFCVNELMGTHTCSDWEIDNYYSELENYQNEAQDFIEDLNNYINEAVEYATCRSNELE